MIDAIGGFSHLKKTILMTIVNQKQHSLLSQIIMSIDSKAIIVVMGEAEVHGSDLTYDVHIE